MKKQRSNLENFGIAMFIVIGVTIGIVLLVNFSHRNSNSDGTSKAAVYTKISDFGTYSDWAQQQISQGISMCATQNKLAETDHGVSVVPYCDSSKSISCTGMNIGNTSKVDCSQP